MSKPATNPFTDNEFTKYFDVSKVLEMPRAFQDFKAPNGFSMEAMMDAQRKNIQALTAAMQTIAEGWQGVVRRQSETVREAIKENSSLMSDMMSSGTPEDKVARQIELARSSFERSMANGKEIAEMVTQLHYDAMEVISGRMGECADEVRSMVRTAASNAKNAAANRS